jgi:hypothetical protein
MKIKDVVVFDEVAEDMNDAKAFYDKKDPRIGDYFWDSLLADMESLLVYGGVHCRVFGLYRLLARRFPYAVYYEVADDIAYVVAVLPMRRDPKWIYKKLKERR